MQAMDKDTLAKLRASLDVVGGWALPVSDAHMSRETFHDMLVYGFEEEGKMHEEAVALAAERMAMFPPNGNLFRLHNGEVEVLHFKPEPDAAE